MEKHKHHIIPKHMGGSDDESNLIELTVKEHAEAHLKLYEKYNKHEDLCAYYMLSGNVEKFRKVYCKLGGLASYEKRKQNGIAHLPFLGANLSEEQKLEIASKGGKVQGKINAENGHMKKIQKIGSSLGGKKSSEICRVKGVNAFFDQKLRLEIASKGGKVQGKINGESGHCKKISQEYWQKVKTGELKRDKKIWITNGKENKMILCEEKINDGWRKGKTQTKKI
jgi:hypothetical protein